MSDFLMSLKDVTLAFGGPSVLDGVSLSVSKGLRAALTGRNGEGKSTLMKVITGELEPDSGEIVRAPGLKTVYVSQEVPADRPGDSAFNALSGGRRRRSILEAARLPRTGASPPPCVRSSTLPPDPDLPLRSVPVSNLRARRRSVSELNFCN